MEIWTFLILPVIILSRRDYISLWLWVARIIIQFYDQFGCQSDVKMTHTICRPLLKMCIRDCVFWITNCNKNKFLQFAIVPWKFQHLWNWHLETKKAHVFLIRFLFCLERKREFRAYLYLIYIWRRLRNFLSSQERKAGVKFNLESDDTRYPSRCTLGNVIAVTGTFV